LINVLLNALVNAQELFNPVTHVVFQVVDDEGEGSGALKDIHFLGLVVGLEVEEEAVLGGEAAMAFHVVH